MFGFWEARTPSVLGLEFDDSVGLKTSWSPTMGMMTVVPVPAGTLLP